MFLLTPQRRDLANGHSFDKGLRVVLPALGFAQPSHRRFGQNGAGAQAQFSTVAEQSPTPSLSYQLSDIGLTMWAATACR